jgi:uncharacterized protein (AIM24 family)
MRSALFAPEMMEQPTEESFTLQNPHLLKVALDGELMARQGSMVAYQGQVAIEYRGAGGIGKFLKRALTGEGAPLMKATGQGTLLLAHQANAIYLIRLDGEGLTVNGDNILAFEPTISWTSSASRVPGCSPAACSIRPSRGPAGSR